jgi:hypothetical protein
MTALTGRFPVELPPDKAFVLFTPLGERTWAAGWDPRFPAATDDDSAPGTVFETAAHAGRTATWIVLDREPGHRIRYARVIPGLDAGTVTVTLDGEGARTAVTVTYELTALSEAGREGLHAFGADYREFLGSWQQAIAAALA